MIRGQDQNSAVACHGSSSPRPEFWLLVRLAEDLADVASRVEIAHELAKIGPERIARRNHAERAAVLDDRHMAEFAFVHQMQRMPEGTVWRDGPGIQCHHFGNARRSGVAAFGGDAKECVTLSKDAGEPVLLDDKERANAVLPHQSRRFHHRDVWGDGDAFLVFDDRADGSVHGSSSLSHTLPQVRLAQKLAAPRELLHAPLEVGKIRRLAEVALDFALTRRAHIALEPAENVLQKIFHNMKCSGA